MMGLTQHYHIIIKPRGEASFRAEGLI